MRGKQVLSGLTWSTVATVLNLLAQLVFMAVLARTLEPAAFGMVAMAALAARFASYFAQMGGAQTLTQATELHSGIATAALVTAGGVSLLLWAALAACAPLFAAYFQAPELKQLIPVFGLTLPLSAIGALPMALLRRQARFGMASSIDVVAYVFGYGLTGVALAATGFGVWSLVAAALTQQGVATLLGFILSQYPLTRGVPREAWRQVLGKGSRYSLIGFLEFLWANVEALLIGRAYGQATLGLFNRAQMLCNMPVEHAVNTVNKVVFPAFSAMQADRARLADGLLLMLAAIGLTSVALAAGIAGASADIVALLLGSRWAQAAPLLQALAAAVPAMFMYTACGITMDSLAALDGKLRLQGGLLLLKVVVLTGAAQAGLMTVLWSLVGLEWLRLVLGLRLLGRLLCLPASTLWQGAGWIALTGLAMFAAVAASSHATLALGWMLPARLLADAVAGTAVIGAIAWLGVRRGLHFAPLQRFEPLRVRALRLQQRLTRPLSR